MATQTRALGLTLAFALACAAGLAARGDDAKPTGDLKAIQGTWVGIPGDFEGSRWVFEGETLKSTVNDVDYMTKVALDPKANPLPAIDFTVTDGPENSKGKTAKGIYKIEGNRLTICVGKPGETRPAEFKAVEKEAFLFELEKEKKP